MQGHIFPADFPLTTDDRTPHPRNLEELRRLAGSERRSVSPSRVSNEALPDFVFQSGNEPESVLMRTVIPRIIGDDRSIRNSSDILFCNLTSLTDNKTVIPKPDFFDGAPLLSLDRQLEQDLGTTIIPNKKWGCPVASNFSLEVKSATGAPIVVARQAMLNGAYGARSMHGLQNYKIAKPEYDNKAYCITATFIAGVLTLYAHHIELRPTTGEPCYYMTLIHEHSLNTEGARTQGIAALRNLRMWCKQVREQFIRVANDRVNLQSESGEARQDDAILDTVTTRQHHGPNPAKFNDHPVKPGDDDRVDATPKSRYDGTDLAIQTSQADSGADSTNTCHSLASMSGTPGTPEG